MNYDDPSLTKPLDSVKNNASNTNWAIFKFAGSSDNLELVSSGDGGFDQFITFFTQKEILYGILRVASTDEFSQSETFKYILIIFSGREASNADKTRVHTTSKPIIENFFKKSYEQELIAYDEDDISMEIIKQKLEPSVAKGTDSGQTTTETQGQGDRAVFKKPKAPGRIARPKKSHSEKILRVNNRNSSEQSVLTSAVNSTEKDKPKPEISKEKKSDQNKEVKEGKKEKKKITTNEKTKSEELLSINPEEQTETKIQNNNTENKVESKKEINDSPNAKKKLGFFGRTKSHFQLNSNKKDKDDSKSPKSKSKSKSQREVVIVKSYNELPKKALDELKKANVSEELASENFLVTLSSLRFVTKVRYLQDESENQKKPNQEHSNLDTLISQTEAQKIVKNLTRIGKGGYASVYRCSVGNEKNLAVKRLENSSSKEKRRNCDEAAFMASCGHPNIVNYHSCYNYKNMTEVWVVMEFMQGGTIEEAVLGTRFGEKDIAYVAREMLNGIKYIHDKGYMHRDLKAANVMCTTEGDVKLIDFGLTIRYSEDIDQKGIAGSPSYIPPEMLNALPQTQALDIWSFGICLLTLANGHPPNHRLKTLKTLIVVGAHGLEEPFDEPGNWGSDFTDFVKATLTKDPKNRATTETLLSHPFIHNASPKAEIKKLLRRAFVMNTGIGAFAM